ncbi:MAG: CAP domain-containing protein [Lysinibacillus sp.]
MKALFRILIVATIIGIIFYYWAFDDEHAPLEGPNTVQQAIPSEQYINDYNGVLSRPATGISTIIGQPVETLVQSHGEPRRVDMSAFGYEWWVYEQAMFGIEQGKVTQVYTNSADVDVSPYKVGQSIEEIYRMTILDAEVSVTIGDNIYMFTMSEEDTKNRLLAKFETLYAQLYIDQEEGELAGVRFIDGKTLVLHQPYEMQFVGELIVKETPSSFQQFEINEASAEQFFELTNVYRKKYGAEPLVPSERLNETAMAHSEDMFLEDFISHDSPTYGSLEKRLEKESISYEEANENVAMAYYDAVEAVHGLLNSPDHRKIMLNPEYTHGGTGVYYDYYTQIFIKKKFHEKSGLQ